ncbi:hypothetical protein A5780_26430 [Nocardia sp. 852002-20019_SCH5090214]|uniref:Uncharacterized protein n=1 Tax=Nocardia africana TaxID=134964 RepID=A0A378X1M4_9NOCA|nr:MULTISPECIES: hypothetical protein [Nocardia]MCC3316782.1 hypothetical protein [Nocardia africana]OBA53654.1 hypothetical protein A5780_26430 [Nocardia sp. 852002-20019_SCH5090214]SUA47500.1 Uncharacterised protein [Nocardia africana]
MDIREWRAARARDRSMYTDAYRRERRRRTLGWLLAVIGLVVGLTHMLTHLGDWHFLWSSGWQDLLVGYPTAAVIAFAGLLLITAPTRQRPNH